MQNLWLGVAGKSESGCRTFSAAGSLCLCREPRSLTLRVEFVCLRLSQSGDDELRRCRVRRITMTETSLTTKSCMQCGFRNPVVAKFCSECGERFVVARVPDAALDSGTNSSTHQGATAPQPVDPRAAFEQFLSSLATEDATSRLRSSIETSRARLKTLGVPLPKATNPILVSLMESLKALPSNEISARIAIVIGISLTGWFSCTIYLWCRIYFL